MISTNRADEFFYDKNQRLVCLGVAGVGRRTGTIDEAASFILSVISV
jgi:hypothetical protein